jgi:hypothetical protein
MARRRTALAQHDLFAAEPAWPAGFAYQEDLIAPADEVALLQNIEAPSFRPFDFHGFPQSALKLLDFLSIIVDCPCHCPWM